MAVPDHSGSTGFPQPHHYAWLAAHPHRTFEWLKEKMLDGFHVHHVDGDHANNSPDNLLLIDGVDHMHLHNGRLINGIKNWRRSVSRRGREAQALKRKTALAKPDLKVPDLVEPSRASEKVVALRPEAKQVAVGMLGAGASVTDVVSAIFDAEVMGYKQTRRAVRRLTA